MGQRITVFNPSLTLVYVDNGEGDECGIVGGHDWASIADTGGNRELTNNGTLVLINAEPGDGQDPRAYAALLETQQANQPQVQDKPQQEETPTPKASQGEKEARSGASRRNASESSQTESSPIQNQEG